VEYGGFETTRAIGVTNVFENVRFQFRCRADQTSYEAARGSIESVYRALDGLAETTLPTSTGTRYSWITAVSPPAFMLYDENGRPNFYANFQARKERG